MLWDSYLVADVKISFIVAMDSAKAALGQQAGRFTAILVALSLLGSLNATILCGGRYLVRISPISGRFHLEFRFNSEVLLILLSMQSGFPEFFIKIFVFQSFSFQTLNGCRN